MLSVQNAIQLKRQITREKIDSLNDVTNHLHDAAQYERDKTKALSARFRKLSDYRHHARYNVDITDRRFLEYLITGYAHQRVYPLPNKQTFNNEILPASKKLFAHLFIQSMYEVVGHHSGGATPLKAMLRSNAIIAAGVQAFVKVREDTEFLSYLLRYRLNYNAKLKAEQRNFLDRVIAEYRMNIVNFHPQRWGRARVRELEARGGVYFSNLFSDYLCAQHFAKFYNLTPAMNKTAKGFNPINLCPFSANFDLYPELRYLAFSRAELDAARKEDYKYLDIFYHWDNPDGPGALNLMSSEQRQELRNSLDKEVGNAFKPGC